MITSVNYTHRDDLPKEFLVSCDRVGVWYHFKVLLPGDWQYVQYSFWFYGLTCLQDAVNEVVTRNSSVVVCVHLAEEVGHSGLLVVHELHKLWEGNAGY